MLDHWSEIAGFTASFLVFVTFSMRTIIPLRMVAILSNLAFIAYGAGAHLLPILILHSALLPLNLLRAYQHLSLFRRIRAAGDGPAEAAALRPFMVAQDGTEGRELFHRGDPAQLLYFLSKGCVLLPEIGKRLGPGEIFGEVGLFSRSGTRTTSAICVDVCEIYGIDRARIHELYTRDPAFGYFLTKLIASRMEENLQRLMAPPVAGPAEGAGAAGGAPAPAAESG